MTELLEVVADGLDESQSASTNTAKVEGLDEISSRVARLDEVVPERGQQRGQVAEPLGHGAQDVGSTPVCDLDRDIEEPLHGPLDEPNGLIHEVGAGEEIRETDNELLDAL